MKTKVIAMLSLSAILFGCGNTTDRSQMGEAAAQEEQHHPQENEAQELELDNGKKWLVNEEMKPFVRKAEQILDDFRVSNATDHLVLAEQLKNENNGLIKSCTMKGKSHDELHKWLYPHIRLIDALSKEDDKEQVMGLILDLKTSFETYHAYFQ